MAQHYVTGVIPMWIGMRVNGVIGAPIFLGFGEKAPEIQDDPDWEPVMCDYGGTKHPSEYLYEGAEASSSVTLTYWRESVVRTITAYPYRTGVIRGTSVINPAAGVGGYGDIGSAMITEGLSFCMWFLFPYSAKAAYRNATNGLMPTGFRMPYTKIQGKPVRRGGTGASKISLNFHHMRGIESSNLVCYDENVTAVANLPWA